MSTPLPPPLRVSLLFSFSKEIVVYSEMTARLAKNKYAPRPGIVGMRGSMVMHATTAKQEIEYISPLEYPPYDHGLHDIECSPSPLPSCRCASGTGFEENFGGGCDAGPA